MLPTLLFEEHCLHHKKYYPSQKVLPLTPTLSHKGRGSYTEFGLTPSPLVGEGWGEG